MEEASFENKLTNLFTNIELNEIDITVNKIIENNTDLNFSLRNFSNSFHFYNQIDGVAMDTPLAHILASFGTLLKNLD